MAEVHAPLPGMALNVRGRDQAKARLRALSGRVDRRQEVGRSWDRRAEKLRKQALRRQQKISKGKGPRRR